MNEVKGRPCCRREPVRDVAIARQLEIRRKNTKTIGKHGEVVEKPLYKCTNEALMHVAAWCHRPRTKVHEIREISFDWPDPPTLPNVVAHRQKVCEISLVEKFCSPGK